MSDRYKSLDALRGIAALVVVVHHCYLTYPTDDGLPLVAPVWAAPLHIFYNGDAAVILFFVLSGFVLSQQFFRPKQPSYPQYLIKRICRIWLPFAVSIIFAFMLFLASNKTPISEASHWFNVEWPAATPSEQEIVGHFLMVGVEPDMNLNLIMWSLVYELRVSLLFPLLIILCRSTSLALILGLGALWLSTKVLALMGPILHPSHALSLLETFLWTIKLTPHFIVGILIAKHHHRISLLIRLLPRKVSGFLLLVPFVAFSVVHSYAYAKLDLLYDVGAASLIILAMEVDYIKLFLDRPVPQWLGHISYSLYLVHYPILLALGYAMLPRLPYWSFAVSVFLISLTAAAVMQHTIEKPAIALGRKLSPGRI